MTTRYGPTRAVPHTLTNPYPDRPARPLVLADAARELLTLADLAPAALAGPQAQGDVAFLPWPPFVAPHLRDMQACAAHRLPRAGRTVLASHDLLAETAPVGWIWWDGPGPTLGTLIVPAGSVARVAHDEHADLRIGPGVYAVRRQRRYAPARNEWVED